MRILVAEDERIIAESYKLLLESRKHRVIVCSDGEQCLNVFNEHTSQMKQQSRATKGANNPDSPFDLLILDYRMPRKNGLEVAEQVLLQVPNQRIIRASAYSHEIINSKGSARSVEILNKPFEFDAFIEMVERGDGNIVGGNKTKQPAKANSIAPNSQVTLKKTSDIGHWRQG